MNYEFYKWPETSLEWKNLSGSNAKRTLILLPNTNSGALLPLLKKILRSVDLDFEEDVHFLGLKTDSEVVLLSDPHLSAYDNILVFGITPAQLGIAARLDDGCHCLYYEKVTCVFSPALEALEEHPEHKRPLWNILKSVFSPQTT